MFDPELYRSKEEVESWKDRDPIEVFRARLEAAGTLSEEMMARLEDEVSKEVDEAVAFAEEGDWEPVDELTRFVYSEVGS